MDAGEGSFAGVDVGFRCEFRGTMSHWCDVGIAESIATIIN